MDLNSQQQLFPVSPACYCTDFGFVSLYNDVSQFLKINLVNVNTNMRASLVAWTVKSLPAVWESQVLPLGRGTCYTRTPPVGCVSLEKPDDTGLFVLPFAQPVLYLPFYQDSLYLLVFCEEHQK